MKALFLDIDGVIQSPYDTKRFEHTSEMVELSKRLTLELDNGFDYYQYGGDQTDRFPPGTQYDVAAVYYDWRPETVERLRRILDDTGAMIVLSSDWREKGLHVMKGLLNIHGLGKYLYPSAPFYTAYWKPYVQEFYTEKELSQMKNETQAIWIACMTRCETSIRTTQGLIMAWILAQLRYVNILTAIKR